MYKTKKIIPNERNTLSLQYDKDKSIFVWIMSGIIRIIT